MKKAAIYARVSTPDQRVENQLTSYASWPRVAASRLSTSIRTSASLAPKPGAELAGVTSQAWIRPRRSISVWKRWLGHARRIYDSHGRARESYLGQVLDILRTSWS